MTVADQEPKMLDEKDVPDEALLEQVWVRRVMQEQMVGTLYPGILEDQILRLQARLYVVKYGDPDRYWKPEENQTGQ